MLIAINIIAPATGSFDTPEIPDTAFIIAFIGIFNNIVTIIPIAPAPNPTITVSALNTLEISFLDAPILLRIPIYLVLSRTEI